MHKRTLVATIVAAAAVLAAAVPTYANGPTTFERTIGDANANNRLEFGPGEGYVVRENLAPAQDGREARRQRVIGFGQLTDFQLADEESPLRFEGLDDSSSLFAGAYRPEEVVASQVVESMVRQLRGIQSPVDGATPENFIITGDSADSSQKNETRDFIDILDGGSVNPDSGRHGLCSLFGGWSRWQPTPPRWQWVSRYAGVRGGGAYYEPDSSAPGVDGPGYSPDQAENFAKTGRSVAVRDFPGLFEAAQLPFRASGLGVPWYSAMGNHDGLVQGNIPNPLLGTNFDSIATGCVKADVAGPGAKAFAPLGDAYRKYMTDPGSETAFDLTKELQRFYKPDARRRLSRAAALVPNDPDRHLLTTEEWVQQHFTTTGAPLGHGFADRPGEGTAYYSTAPKPGVRYVGLDSVDHDGLANGRIDDRQFQWLESELQASAGRGERVVVFAHHTLKTMDNGLDLPPADPDYHFGLASQNGVPPHAHGESLESLFLRYPNVIAYVSGHEHENRVTPYRQDGMPGRFWELSTAAHIDWPSQSRLIDIFDNEDGTLSIFATMVDHLSQPDPGDNPDLSDPLALASIGRELTYNDKQASTGEDGTADARGAREDRNVELILPKP